MSVVLIGFMGAGKTTVGRALSEKLGWPVWDTDELIQQKAGCTVSEIFERHGEACFRKMEQDLLKELADRKEKGVISTGGGMPVYAANRPLLQEIGPVIYLKVKPETVLFRLKGDHTRPLLQGDGARDRVYELLKEREAAYQDAAGIVLEADEKSAEELAEEIKERIL